MKIGDLVQCNIFDKKGSGSYGLVTSKYPTPGYWEIMWSEDDWRNSLELHGTYEVHEKDLVVVSEA